MAKRNIEQNLAKKMRELRGEKELSERGREIRQRVHNSLNPFSEDIISPEDEEKILDFVNDLIDKAKDKEEQEMMILIKGILQEFFKEKKSKSYPNKY